MRGPVTITGKELTTLSTPLNFASFESPFGLIYAAMDGSALVALSFCPAKENFLSILSGRFGPLAAFNNESSPATLKPLFSLFHSYFMGRPVDFNHLQVKVFGTDFERSVLSALREIPYGTSCSYAAIAAAIGRPRAFRAVANACAGNMIPIVIPCHRVVRSDGSPGGWSGGGGPKVKEGLLALEGLRFEKEKKSRGKGLEES